MTKYNSKQRSNYMKFYSDVTKKLYETQEDLIKAEKEIKDKESNRAKRAKEVETAISAAESAQKKANKLLNDFFERLW